MRPHTLASSFALVLLAGCASAPPPAPKAATTAPAPQAAAPASGDTAPALAEAPPPPDGDVEFVVSTPKAKTPKQDVDLPANSLHTDSASGGDVKNVHLNAARR